MAKRTTGILLLAAIIFRILGNFFSTTSSLQALLNLTFVSAWLVLLAISLIGAMIRTAQLRRWGWFIALWFVVPIIPYIFWGPSERKGAYSSAARRNS
jgi:hypothetical protein